MLVELKLMEQRHKAVLEVLDGAAVTDVARRYGVARQTVHDWLARYAKEGLAGLADRSSRPASCPHQMPPMVEAPVVEMRLAHPAWGPAAIRYELAKGATSTVPGRSSIYRALVRHRLVEAKNASGAGLITSVSNEAGLCNCGRWTSWAASTWPTAPS